MSLFAEKWTSPFNNNPFGLLDDFHPTSFGEFLLGPNFNLCGKDTQDSHPLKMKLRNGSVATERGFYDHFDSIFHDRSRRYDLRTAAASDSRRSSNSAGKGKEYIIPIKLVTSPKEENTGSPSSTASTNSTSNNSSGRVIEIPVKRECSSQKSRTERDKSRSPILQQSSKVQPSSFKPLTPTTVDSNYSRKRDTSNDVVLDCDTFFERSGTDKPRQTPESNIEIVEVENDDAFIRSLRRKPLRHCQDTLTSPSSYLPENNATSANCSQIATDFPKKLPPSSNDGKDDKSSDVTVTEKDVKDKRSVCCHPGPTDIMSPPSYPIYDYLIPRLAEEDRQIDYIRGDGNCFFRAISKDVYGSEEFHAECRDAICDLIQNSPDVFRQYIDGCSVTSHVVDMRVHGTWATTCEIYAAATLLRREIYVLVPTPSSDSEYHWLLFSPRCVRESSIGSSRNSEQDGKELQPCYVTLCHTNANHYDRITPFYDCCNCQLTVPSLSGVSVSLDLTTSDQEEVCRKA